MDPETPKPKAHLHNPDSVDLLGPASPAASSVLDRLVDGFGGWDAIEVRCGSDAVVATPHAAGSVGAPHTPSPVGVAPGCVPGATVPEIREGTVVGGRYEVLGFRGRGATGIVLSAFDRSTRETAALRVLRPGSRSGSDDLALRQEVVLARSVGHPNVCRVHDLEPSPWGPIVVMEEVRGETLEARIRERRVRGGLSLDELRSVATDMYRGLAAIHAGGLIHGDIRPSNVMITPDKAVILDFGLGREAARARGGDPLMERRRQRYRCPGAAGGPTAADDVYAAAVTLWETWGSGDHDLHLDGTPRSKPLRSQALTDLPWQLSADELKQLFHALSHDPSKRPYARRVHFHRTVRHTASLMPAPSDCIHAGPPPSRAATRTFTPGAQSLLVTHAPTAPGLVGGLLPLDRPALVLGRRRGQDLVLADKTVSNSHVRLTWRNASWLVEDLGSTNGSYVERDYARQRELTLRHGGEAYVGEARVMLVGFGRGSPHHEAARRHLSTHDGSRAC